MPNSAPLAPEISLQHVTPHSGASQRRRRQCMKQLRTAALHDVLGRLKKMKKKNVHMYVKKEK
jgi:hypothetical protein